MNDFTNMVRHGDCIEVMRGMEPNSIDSIVTDPPYGLGFMGKAWDKLPPSKEWAEECLRVLKPGGHMLAFGGTRTWHRLAVAIEDAGFEVRDSIAWMYGTGFPKSLNIGGGLGTSLKPAFEPILVARKPMARTVAWNVSVYGTGALNIDKSRTPEGRFPANVALDEEQARILDGQSGIKKDAVAVKRNGVVGGAYSPAAAIGTPDAGYGGTGGASRFFYVAKAPKSERPIVDGVTHPTVKPLTLMRYLVKLVTPADGVVLDPFAGSGTTLEAATLDGFRAVGIEAEVAYLPLIEQRLGRVA